MATLVKLQISGIRSFGPFEDQAQTLTFTTPVTLILGQNGCGKTTIIEAIKYVCTGELPAGTNSGQGFVNDPKMSRTSTTKGQIKLKLLDQQGNEVTVSRVVEVSQTATSLKFCCKSSAIRTVTPAREDKSLSGRCADITNECCQIMNVTPAVLNNVIFCHQENSAWPLDEGKKLKEKFDEIFDAQKYNQCCNDFRALLKKKDGNLKLIKAELLHRRDKKECMEKERRILQDKEDKLQAFVSDIQAKKEELEPLKQRIVEIFQLEEKLGQLREQLKVEETKKSGIIEEQKTIKKGLSEFEGSDEELHDKIRTFEADRKRNEELIVGLEKKIVEIDSKSKVVAQAIQEGQIQRGKLNQEKNQYEKKCAERNNAFRGVQQKMPDASLPNFEENEGAKSALYKLEAVVGDAEKKFNDFIEDSDLQQAVLQSTVDEARENAVRTKQNVASKEREIKENEQKVKEISNELLSLSSADQRLKSCSQRISTIEKTITNLKAKFRETEENEKAEGYKSSIQTMEKELEKLEAEYKILQRNDVIEGKIETENNLIMEKQIEINRIKVRHAEGLKHLFGDNIPEKKLKEPILAMQKKAGALVTSLLDKIAKKQKEVTTFEVKCQNQQEKIKTTEKELQSKRARILEACNGDNFNETLERAFQKKERLQVDKGQYSSVKIIYGQFVKKFEEEAPCCPVCETKFNRKENAVKKIIAALKSKLDRVPQELNRVESELEKEEATYNKLQQLKTTNDDVEVMAKDIMPLLKDSLSEIEQSWSREKAELQELQSKIVEPQIVLEICKHIISDVSSLDQNQLDVDKSVNTVRILKQGLVEVPSNKSKQEVEVNIEYLKSGINEMRRKVDAHVKFINMHKDQLQELAQKRMGLLDEQMRLKDGIQSTSVLETQKNELTDKIANLKEELSDLVDTLMSLDAELQSAIENKEKVARQNKQRIQEERSKLDTFKKTVGEIRKLQAEIDDYLRKKVDTQLAAVEEKIMECETKEVTLHDTRNKVIGMISSKKEDVAKHAYTFKTLQHNVILREKKALEVDLEIRIQELREKIGGYNYRSVDEEKQRLLVQREKFEKQINNLTGEKNGLAQSIEELRQELATPAKKKAYANYMSKLYELKIAEHVISDLIKYISALEKAVLEFHKAKMTQINKNIRELWRDIYRGNDIDYIEIKTEYASGKATRRSYNYKVVQVKKGIELDMRGRCSAGQKVLACLIIRMALAETLSSNCGILALDEPTTNLDRENIQSLSETLSRVVTSRQKEKNFQLLIITHDEEFLNTLTRVQSVSHFFRVQRNDDGFSLIQKEYM